MRVNNEVTSGSITTSKPSKKMRLMQHINVIERSRQSEEAMPTAYAEAEDGTSPSAPTVEEWGRLHLREIHGSRDLPTSAVVKIQSKLWTDSEFLGSRVWNQQGAAKITGVRQWQK
jgi:hypothetical protein